MDPGHEGELNKMTVLIQFTVYFLLFVQSRSRVWLFATPLTVACQCPSTFPRACLKLMSIESVMPSNFLVLCHPLFILPSIFPSIKVFSNELALCIKWPKHCNFSISEYSGLISFRIAGWISLQSKGLSRVFCNTTVQKHEFFNTAFFMVQLSHPFMTTEKIYIALTRWTFVSKVMSLLFNTQSRIVIAFLPRNKCLLIS